MAPFAAPALAVLAGPTATGKTALALEWAEAWGAEILNADSLCLYRGMEIGTAKPTAVERARVPHHLIDLAPAHRGLSVADYAAAAAQVVADLTARGRPALIVGGSGFYLASYWAPVAGDAPVPEALRQRARELEAQGGLDALLGELRQQNPQGWPDDFDARNPRRVAAALARGWATGQTIAEQRAALAAAPRPYPAARLACWWLDREDGELRQRIAERTRAMLAAGLVDEVRHLLGQGLLDNPSAALAVGYRETIAWLRAPTTEVALAEAIVASTWALVRKQRGWLRHQLPPGAVRLVTGASAPPLPWSAPPPFWS